MNKEQALAEIREANLTYLMLAQRLIREDRAEAIIRLGMSEANADLIERLSPAQLLKLASGSMLLCRLRVEDDLVWQLLTNHGVSRVDSDAATRLHANILMTSRYAEAM